MALGITRESVGDILVEDGRAVVFLKDEVLNFVITNIAKIGGVGVSAKIGFDLPLPEADALIDLSVTVSSLRLDCVVAALCGVSRNKANEIIAMGFVSVNSLVFEKSTKQITDGDVLSVRGKGKFIVKSTLNKTKKDRTVLEFKKYL
jgi:RNA-binding protein YlmH